MFVPIICTVVMNEQASFVGVAKHYPCQPTDPFSLLLIGNAQVAHVLNTRVKHKDTYILLSTLVPQGYQKSLDKKPCNVLPNTLIDGS